MKPKNFPGRKNDRRNRAFARMKYPTRATGGALSHAERAVHPYFITQSRIVPDAVARGIRTKKDRSAGSKFRA
jgi:hypothetical protein